jgi:hypothetical protein
MVEAVMCGRVDKNLDLAATNPDAARIISRNGADPELQEPTFRSPANRPLSKSETFENR